MSHSLEKGNETQKGLMGSRASLLAHSPVEGVVINDPSPSFLLFSLFSAGNFLLTRSIFVSPTTGVLKF